MCDFTVGLQPDLVDEMNKTPFKVKKTTNQTTIKPKQNKMHKDRVWTGCFKFSFKTVSHSHYVFLACCMDNNQSYEYMWKK